MPLNRRLICLFAAFALFCSFFLASCNNGSNKKEPTTEVTKAVIKIDSGFYAFSENANCTLEIFEDGSFIMKLSKTVERSGTFEVEGNILDMYTSLGESFLMEILGTDRIILLPPEEEDETLPDFFKNYLVPNDIFILAQKPTIEASTEETESNILSEEPTTEPEDEYEDEYQDTYEDYEDYADFENYDDLDNSDEENIF